MIRMILGVTAVMMLAAPALAAAAEAYPAGHGALEVFDGAGMAAAPLWVRIWVGFMLFTFAMSVAFVKKEPLARWALGGLACSMLITPQIFALLGLPYLSGAIAIGHILFWSPALILLLVRRPFLDAEKDRAFRIWSGLMAFVIGFSFVFDVRDAAIYTAHFAG